MLDESFIFTIFFLTLGPIKIIPAFAKLTQQASLAFKREVAIKSTLIATAITVLVALLGRNLLGKYGISFDALEIAGGLVLLLSALNVIFPKFQPSPPQSVKPTALQLAISPVATPIVVPPVGIAAILLFVMLDSQYPGIDLAIGKAILTMMVLDFLVMFFIDNVVKVPGLMPTLQVCGAVLVFIQVALAMELIVQALTNLGLFKG